MARAVQLFREECLTTRQATDQKGLSQNAVSRAVRDFHGGTLGRPFQFTKFEEEFIFRYVIREYKKNHWLTHETAVRMIIENYLGKSRDQQEDILRYEFPEQSITPGDVT
jgi:hypothetical protein